MEFCKNEFMRLFHANEGGGIINQRSRQQMFELFAEYLNRTYPGEENKEMRKNIILQTTVDSLGEDFNDLANNDWVFDIWDKVKSGHPVNNTVGQIRKVNQEFELFDDIVPADDDVIIAGGYRRSRRSRRSRKYHKRSRSRRNKHKTLNK